MSLASPLQLKGLVFEKVCIEPEQLDNPPEEWFEGDFSFEGVKRHLNVKLAVKNEDPDELNEFLVTVRMQIKNKDGKKSPYRIDVSASGFISTVPEFTPPNKMDLVRVNGASMVYGAIRELVANITGRQVFGMLWLPTVRIPPESGPEEERAKSSKKQLT